MIEDMVFIETSLFTKLLPRYLGDDEFSAFQWYLLANPDAGDLVRSSGGVRKVRWSLPGRGKSGGVRIIYYWKTAANEIWLLTLYSKNEKATIPGHILKAIAREIEDE